MQSSTVKLAKRILVGVLLLLVIAACGPPKPNLAQPLSPPPHIVQSTLQDRWQLTDVIVQGQVVNFDLFKPIHLSFGGGILTISSQRCGYGRYAVVYSGERNYRFTDSMYTAQECGGEILQENPTIDCTTLAGSNPSEQACAQAVAEQWHNVSESLRATDEFEIAGNTLILRGPQTEMRLVREGQ